MSTEPEKDAVERRSETGEGIRRSKVILEEEEETYDEFEGEEEDEEEEDFGEEEEEEEEEEMLPESLAAQEMGVGGPPGEGGAGGGGDADQLTEENDSKKGSVDDGVGYKIRPDLTHKFRPGVVQVIIEQTIKEHLEGKEFSAEESEEWVRLILEGIHEKVKEQKYKRYKIISHITLGERRGEGAASATRCLWDAEADCMATYTYLTEGMFCNGTVYGIYFY